MDAHRPQALEGIRVLELAGCEGEYCGKLLADLGADVIKVEPPDGSPCRREPPFIDDLAGPDRSLHFLYFNTNKRSITADMRTDRGGDAVVRQLARNTDILIESSSPSSPSPLGLSYDELRRVNPRLVYASITPFGQSGPYSNYRANDLVAFAMGGLMYVSGKPSSPPVCAPGRQSFLVGSAHAAMAILIALWNVRQGGAGQHIDVAMFDCLAAMENLISRSANVGGYPRREGSQHRFATPGTIYRCQDGFVHMFVTNSQIGSWERFLDWLGRPEALCSEEFKDSVYRRKHVAIVDRVVAEFVKDLPKQTVFEALQARHIPCAPVNTPLDFVRDPHIRARGFIIDTVHPRHGRMAVPGSPFKMDSWRLRKHAPGIGEDSETILAELKQPRSAPVDAENTQLAAFAHALPLKGIRIADFTHMVAGPYGTMQLAYFGAEVIKVESTVRPDTWRIREGNKDVEASLPFADHNKNKLSVTMNLKSAEGRELARRLIALSDVVVENFSAGVMERFGLGYQELQAIKPNIIMVRLQGLGSTGPRKDYVTWGPSLMPFAGVSYLWNHPDEELPVGSQTSYPDYIVSIHMAYVLMAALHHRRNTGAGQLIDIAQSEVTASLIGPALLDALVNQRVSEPVGNRSDRHMPHGCYPCRGDDEWCVISVTDDDAWRRFCAATKNDALVHDERFASLPQRRANGPMLDALVSAWTRERSAQEVMEILQSAGIHAGRVSNGTMLATDPHLRTRASLVEQEHPRQGRLTLLGIVVKLSETPGAIRRHAPLLGQDNDYVLRELLGLSEDDIQRRRDAGAF